MVLTGVSSRGPGGCRRCLPGYAAGPAPSPRPSPAGPPAGSIPPVLAVTSPGLAVVRMHGHSAKWESKDIHERFGYRYTDAELQEWAPRVRALAKDTDTTHVLFNNCYRNYAQVNAQQLAALLQA